MTNVESWCCVPLTEEQRSGLRERLRLYRANLLDLLLDDLQDVSVTARLGDRIAEIHCFLLEVFAGPAESSEQLANLIDNWAVTFLLSRLVHDDIRDTTRINHLVSCLTRMIEFAPWPVSRSWKIPVIEDARTLGLEEFQPEDEDLRWAEPEDWRPLSLEESLEGAYTILEELWPEVQDWVEILVPAFVNMGGLPSRSIHRSASYGAGTPIFLTKVGDPFQHAEDIVHELQHERLHLLMPDSFAGGNDLRPHFISPYRSDPRPLKGLYLGLHAFLAVNELRLHARARTGLSMARLYQTFKTHRMNLCAFRTLREHAELEPQGRKLFAKMACCLAEQHGLIEPLVTAEMEGAFARWLDRHVSSVRSLASEIVNGSELYTAWEQTAEIAASYAASAGGDHEGTGISI